MLKSLAPAILSYEDQSPFLTSISNAMSSIYIFSAPVNKENSNFQNSPLIVPTFYNMAQQNANTGITAVSIGSSIPVILEGNLSKDEIITIKSTTENGEQFIPQQQILANKVKLSFIENPQEAGNYQAVKANQSLKNISFNYPRTESNLTLDNSNLYSDYTIEKSVENVFNSLQTNRTDNVLWKWFVWLTLLFLVLELLIQKFVK